MRSSGMTDKPATNRAIPWLLNGDPAIRWQTMRDLAGAAESAFERERSKVARTGWGPRLLGRQDPAGTWGGGPTPQAGLYTPKVDFDYLHDAGKTFFELERIGAPSRWNTLRALRVLKWWDRTSEKEKGPIHT